MAALPAKGQGRPLLAGRHQPGHRRAPCERRGIQYSTVRYYSRLSSAAPTDWDRDAQGVQHQYTWHPNPLTGLTDRLYSEAIRCL